MVELSIVSWLENFNDGSDELDAQVRLEVDGINLTAVVDFSAHSARETVYISAARLARWLLINWWRHRYETATTEPSFAWRCAHEMGSIGGGYRWPPLTITSDGLNIVVTRETPRGSHRLQYIADVAKPVRVSVASFDRAVEEFIEAVVARSSELSVAAGEVSATYDALLAERANADRTRFRKREALSGYNPDDLPLEVETTLSEADRLIGASAVDELWVAVAASECEDPSAAFATAMASVESYRANALRLHPSFTADVDFASETVGRLPHELGYEAARLLRGRAGLPERLTDDVFASFMQIQEGSAAVDDSPSFLEATSRPVPLSTLAFSVGVRRFDGGIDAILRKRGGSARRFEIARLLGDHVFLGGDNLWLPVTDARTYRQRFQRAFAAEFLCPIHVLRPLARSISDMIDADDVGAYFGVSSEVVRYQLINHGLSAPKAAEPDLIAAGD